MPRVARCGWFLTARALAAPALAAFLSSSCGSSSQTATVTGPSSDKCALEVAAETAALPWSGGSGAIRISANRECGWSAKSDAAWMTLAAPAEGQGDGTVRFAVVANAQPSSRTGGISVNGTRVEISQAGRPCEFTLSSKRESVEGTGGERAIDVRVSAAACAWTAASNVPWITIVSGRAGSGNGSVTFHVDPASGPPRAGSLTIAGERVDVEQGTGCSYAIGVDAFSVAASGGERQVPVTTAAGCAWTAESGTPWLTITSGSTGSGAAVVVFRVAPTDGPARTGTLTVAGRTVTVTQTPGCTYALNPTSLSVNAQGGTSSIQVEAGAGCAWKATTAATWITISAGASGDGKDQVQLTIAANDGPARTGSITIAGQTLSVSQANGCKYAISPSDQNVPGTGGNGAVSVATGSGCTWTASSAADWIALSTTSGTGAGQAAFTVAANASPPRTGRLTIAGRTFTISQASQCAWSFAPPSHEFPATSSFGSVLVFVTGACSWTAVSTVDWIQIVAGTSGVGGGLLQFSVPANPGPERVGIIVVGGESYRVHQQGS